MKEMSTEMNHTATAAMETMGSVAAEFGNSKCTMVYEWVKVMQPGRKLEFRHGGGMIEDEYCLPKYAPGSNCFSIICYFHGYFTKYPNPLYIGGSVFVADFCHPMDFSMDRLEATSQYFGYKPGCMEVYFMRYGKSHNQILAMTPALSEKQFQQMVDTGIKNGLVEIHFTGYHWNYLTWQGQQRSSSNEKLDSSKVEGVFQLEKDPVLGSNMVIDFATVVGNYGQQSGDNSVLKSFEDDLLDFMFENEEQIMDNSMPVNEEQKTQKQQESQSLDQNKKRKLEESKKNKRKFEEVQVSEGESDEDEDDLAPADYKFQWEDRFRDSDYEQDDDGCSLIVIAHNSSYVLHLFGLCLYFAL